MSKGAEKKPTINKGDTINDRYKVFNCLGQGGFGVVYEVYDMKNKEIYALKMELVRPDPKEPGISLEISALKKLQHNGHIPRFIENAKHGKCDFVVMQLVGRNLGDIRRSCPKFSFTFSTSVRISLACLEIVEIIHGSGYLHRDIKPTNFTIGATPKDIRTIYVLDFGLVRKFLTNDDKVRNPRAVAGFRGSVKYASLNAHKNADLGRNDDLWSWYYMVVEFMKGELPWRSEKDREKVGQLKEVAKEDLLKNIQPEISKIFDMLSQLKYLDQPNYHALKSVFSDLMQRKNFTHYEPYDWEKGGLYYDASKIPTVKSIKKKKDEMTAMVQKDKKKVVEEKSKSSDSESGTEESEEESTTE